MKVVLDQKELNSALDRVSATISNNNKLSILKGVKITIQEQKCTLESTNLSSSTKTTINAEGKVDFTFAVECSVLSQLIKKLEVEKVFFELKKNIITISAPGFSTSLPVMKVEDFPELNEISGTEISLKGESLISAIGMTSFASIDRDDMPILKCIHIEGVKNSLLFTALDGTRLAHRGILAEGEGLEDVKVNIPAKELVNIIKNIPNTDKEIRLIVGEEYTSIVTDANAIYTMQNFKAEFIDYKKIIPKKFTTDALVDINELNNAIDIVNIFKSSKGTIMKMSLNKESGKIKIHTDHEKGTVEKEITATQEGADILIGFNAKFFDGLNYILKYTDVEKVYLKFNDPLKPLVILPTEKSLKYIYFIMPARLHVEETKEKEKKTKKEDKE
jgi:DNA polymerase-3 subunit beta